MNTQIKSMFPEHFLRNYIGLDFIDNTSNYPPHNIEKIDNDDYILTIAVAGFSRENLNAYVQSGRLIISGSSVPKDTKQTTFVHKGISLRDFKREFILGEDVEVAGISLDHGLLEIKLHRKIPESAKPKYIDIIDGSLPVESPKLKIAK